jgi:aquaporin Z
LNKININKNDNGNNLQKEVVKIPWTLFASEFLGTAILIGVGVSFVILDFGNNSPVVRIIHDAGLRRAITGFLFGSTGALIAVSWIGKESGAHINPVVTLAFWMRGKMGAKHAIGYIFFQLVGGIAGALPLLLWGRMGSSINYGGTYPGQAYSVWIVLLGESAASFALILLLFIFIGHKKLRQFTPLLFPVLYLIMVYLEAPISGTSTNPARTLGPEIISNHWAAWWVYWIAPVAGALIGVAVHKISWFRRFKIEVAKLYHFEFDRHGVFKASPK